MNLSQQKIKGWFVYDNMEAVPSIHNNMKDNSKSGEDREKQCLGGKRRQSKKNGLLPSACTRLWK